MDNSVFLSAVKKLTEQNITVGELIGATESLKASKQSGLAIQLYNLWTQFNQADPLLYIVYFNYAVLLSDAGDLAGAKNILERALTLNPDFFPAYINLGSVLERLGSVGDAVRQWSALVGKVAAVTGSAVNYKITALKQIGRVMEINQHSAQAEDVMRQSLEINSNQPDVLQHFIALRLSQCEWPVVSPWDSVSKKVLMKGIGPLSMSIYTDDPILQLASAWNYSKNFIGYPNTDFQDSLSSTQASRPGRRRIGYVSSDLRNHAVGFIMAELFEQHDRSEFEIFVYYCGIPHPDAMKSRIKDAVEHWVDISAMDDDTAARQIMLDGIDILVDVNGFTKDARTKMFALKPAPVVVNWLGYPGSMGSPYHHYIIADDWIIPKDFEKYYSEKVVRLPCYQSNDRKRAASHKQPTRMDVGLPEDAMVFCCFNGVQKVNRFTFDRWMTILEHVPGSVLWLLTGSEATSKRLQEYAKKRGIAPERVVFADKMPNADHLARYPLADLFLDTTPYGAHVTASDALWMGVPILTFSGRSFASRVCGSLTRAAGLPEMVCATPEEYVEKAIALGNDKEEIRCLKKKLVAGRDSCVLFDIESTAQHLEALYKQMWKEFQQGQLPRPNLVNLDLYGELGGEFDHEAVEMLTVPDYEGLYKTKLARRHKYCAIPEDTRLWTAADIAQTESEVRSAAPVSLVKDSQPLRKKKR